MENQLKNKIICGNSEKLSDIIKPNSVDLCIVVPPYKNLENYDVEIKEIKSNKKPSKHNETYSFLNTIDKILTQISKITKPNGICCLITSDDMDVKRGVMKDIGMETIWRIAHKNNPSWKIIDRISWVKATLDSVVSLHNLKQTIWVGFDEISFSDILILVKSTSKFEYPYRSELISNLHISQGKKSEMLSDMWFIPPKKENNFLDHLPKELLIRLIMMYSKEGNLVLDPFSRYGITAIVSKNLKRNYLCIDKNTGKIKLSKKRVQTLFKER